MAVKEYYGVLGQLTSNVSTGSPLLPVNSTLSGAIAATFINGVDVAFFSVRTANFYELIKIIAVNGLNLTVVRAQGGTTARAFPIGAELRYETTSESVIEQIGSISTDVTVTGGGLVQVNEPAHNVFKVVVPSPAFTSDNGISIVGEYPNMHFAFTREADDCCETGEGSSRGEAVTTIEGEGLVTAIVNGGTAIIRVASPIFTAGPGVSIVGAWPSYNISATSGSGTVQVVGASGGLQVTGAPTVNPTLSIASSGVTAGTYGGIAINARGQITAVPSTLSPVSIVVVGAGLGYSRVGDAVTLTPVVGSVGVKGILELADETDPFNSADNTSAASPAVVALALETLVLADVLAASSYNGEVDANYTNLISGSNVAVVLVAGQKAMVSAEVVVVDGASPLVPVAFGIAVFSTAPARINSNRKVTQSIQNMQFVITGPLTATLGIATTALPAGASATSYSLNIVTF